MCTDNFKSICFAFYTSFLIVNFPFLDGDVLLALSYGVCISQLLRFARVCCNVLDFNERNRF